jgi:hypothetical protein
MDFLGHLMILTAQQQVAYAAPQAGAQLCSTGLKTVVAGHAAARRCPLAAELSWCAECGAHAECGVRVMWCKGMVPPCRLGTGSLLHRKLLPAQPALLGGGGLPC